MNGQVRVRFISSGQSGTATITAFSGGASGKLENLRVGTAAAERVLLTATPAVLPPSGGTTEIAARVEDVTGAGLPGVPVSFTADQGQLGAGSATTDSSGVAKTSLTATRTTIVTANVAGKTATVTVNLNARTGISITGPTTAVAAGTPITFTVGVGAAPAVNIRDVTVDFGDGVRSSLGAISTSTPVQHTYIADGSYRAAATATEASGFTETVATFRYGPAAAAAERHHPAVEPESDPWRDGHLHGHGVGCDLHDSALRVELRSGRVPAARRRLRATERPRRTTRRHKRHHCESRPGVRPPRRGYGIDSRGCGGYPAVVARS